MATAIAVAILFGMVPVTPRRLSKVCRIKEYRFAAFVFDTPPGVIFIKSTHLLYTLIFAGAWLKESKEKLTIIP
jgi:hypothetical protein